MKSYHNGIIRGRGETMYFWTSFFSEAQGLWFSHTKKPYKAKLFLRHFFCYMLNILIKWKRQWSLLKKRNHQRCAEVCPSTKSLTCVNLQKCTNKSALWKTDSEIPFLSSPITKKKTKQFVCVISSVSEEEREDGLKFKPRLLPKEVKRVKKGASHFWLLSFLCV